MSNGYAMETSGKEQGFVKALECWIRLSGAGEIDTDVLVEGKVGKDGEKSYSYTCKTGQSK